MSQNKTLETVDRKIFKTYFEDGLIDMYLAAFVLMFAVAPLLSGTLGDFWSSFIFLPFFGLVYLVLRYLRRRVVTPRIGTVKWGDMRKRKLRKGTLTMLVINLVFLALGVVAFFMPIGSGFVMSLRFGIMMLVLFSAAGYYLDMNFLFVYGVMIALAMPVGEWLYQTAGFTHHGYPLVFGSMAGVMFVRGLYKFIHLIRESPLDAGEPTS
jgi:MFS family permease